MGLYQTDSFTTKRRFIVKLGKALHQYGTPAYRLEAHLKNVSKLLGVKANFMVTPTSLSFLLSDDNDEDYNTIVRVMPGDLDLGALARIDQLVDELDSGQRSLSDAIERLDYIPKKPSVYHAWLTFLAFGGASGSFAMLIQANWHSVILAALLSLLVAGVTFLSAHSSRVGHMLEPFIAFLVAFFSAMAAVYEPNIQLPLVILSGIIVYIPGLALAIGLSELASRHLMSGTARVMDAVMSLFKLYIGAILGIALARLIWGEIPNNQSEGVPEWTLWLAVTSLSLSLAVLFKVRKRDIFWGVLSGYIAFAAALWGGVYLDAGLGAFVGAFALGLYSNVFSRLMNLPSSIVMLQGLVLLVPGSKLYIGLNAAIAGVAISSGSVGAESFLIFMSLIAGLIFADVILPSQKTL